MHSMFSDGSMTPEELIAEAATLGLKGVALTDHDSVAGIPRFLEAAQAAGVPAIAGVEVSADIEVGTLHVLGYGVDYTNREFLEHLRWIREGRNSRNQEMLQKLNRLGLRLTIDDVQRHAGADVVARPHFAQALIAKGYVKDKREAFERYLAKGKPGYAERRRLNPEATMELLRMAGGLPVIAHPFTLKRTVKEMKPLLAHLKQFGLAGVEVYYSEHNRSWERSYLKLCKEFGLIATGGSDFHGTISPGIKMGKGIGTLNVPDEVWEALQQELTRS